MSVPPRAAAVARLATLALLGIATSACQPTDPAARPLPIGTCAVAPDADELHIVPCASPHTHVLVAHLSGPADACPAGTEPDWTIPDVGDQAVRDCWATASQEEPSP